MASQGIPTIEGEVHRVLFGIVLMHLVAICHEDLPFAPESGAISDANAMDRKKVKWSSASRTDKVSPSYCSAF